MPCQSGLLAASDHAVRSFPVAHFPIRSRFEIRVIALVRLDSDVSCPTLRQLVADLPQLRVVNAGVCQAADCGDVVFAAAFFSHMWYPLCPDGLPWLGAT